MEITIYKKVEVDEEFLKIFNYQYNNDDSGLPASQNEIREWLELCVDACISEIRTIHEDELAREQRLLDLGEVLQRPINDLYLSVRAYNALVGLGLKTVRDLVNLTPNQILTTKNVGRHTLKEIIRVLKEEGLSLREPDGKSDISLFLLKEEDFLPEEETEDEVKFEDVQPTPLVLRESSRFAKQRNLEGLLKFVFMPSSVENQKVIEIRPLSKEQLESKIWGLIGRVTNLREYTILYLFWANGMTYKQIGARFSVTPERIRQLMSKATHKLRRMYTPSFIWIWQNYKPKRIDFKGNDE